MLLIKSNSALVINSSAYLHLHKTKKKLFISDYNFISTRKIFILIIKPFAYKKNKKISLHKIKLTICFVIFQLSTLTQKINMTTLTTQTHLNMRNLLGLFNIWTSDQLHAFQFCDLIFYYYRGMALTFWIYERNHFDI